jgi:hypothetical protein
VKNLVKKNSKNKKWYKFKLRDTTLLKHPTLIWRTSTPDFVCSVFNIFSSGLNLKQMKNLIVMPIVVASVNSYFNKDKEIQHCATVQGSEEEIAEYVNSQSEQYQDKYIVDSTHSLFWTQRPISKGDVVTCTSNGKWVTGDLMETALAIESAKNTFIGRVKGAAILLGKDKKAVVKSIFAVEE